MEEMTSELRVAGTWSLRCLPALHSAGVSGIFRDLLTGMGVSSFHGDCGVMKEGLCLGGGSYSEN